MTTKLTKRSEDFVFHLEKLLKEDETFDQDKIKSVISEVENQLEQAQKSGHTAKQVLGTPAGYLADLKDPKAAAQRKKLEAQQQARTTQAANTARYGDVNGPGLFDFSFFQQFVDTSLSIFVLFTALYGLVGLFTDVNSQNASGNLGFVTIILISIFGSWLYVGGLRRVIYDPKVVGKTPLSFGRRLLYLAGLIVFWVVGFMLLSIIPKSINPTLSPLLYLILAILGILAVRYWRKRTGLPNNLLSISELMRNSGARARDAAAKNKK